MATLSTIIITKNEEKQIKACIESVLWSNEIIVLDSGSTDHTVKICREFAPKVKLFETDWPGFGKQKNRALGVATSDWVLSIDADEVVTPELAQEILQVLNHNDSVAAYQIPRLNYLQKIPLRHCFKKDLVLRLFRRGQGSFSNEEVHEKVLISDGGKIKSLKNRIDHFSFASLEAVIAKMNNYSSLGARKLYAQSNNNHITNPLVRAGWIFIKIYFLNLGFLDGWPGFIIAFSNFEGVFYKYAKLRQQNLRARQS